MNSTPLVSSHYAFSGFTYNAPFFPDETILTTLKIAPSPAVNNIEGSVKQKETLEVYLSRMDQPHLAMPKRFHCLMMAIKKFAREYDADLNHYETVKAYFKGL